MPISVSSSKLIHCYLKGTSGFPQMNNLCLTVVRTRKKCVSFSVALTDFRIESLGNEEEKGKAKEQFYNFKSITMITSNM